MCIRDRRNGDTATAKLAFTRAQTLDSRRGGTGTAISLLPVSYTHLDVYKRQMLMKVTPISVSGRVVKTVKGSASPSTLN